MPGYDSDEPGWDEAELDRLNEVQSAMVELEPRRQDEHRDLTAPEKAEMRRLRAKEHEVFGVEPWHERLLTPIAIMFSMAVVFGGTMTALVVTLLVGLLLSG